MKENEIMAFDKVDIADLESVHAQLVEEGKMLAKVKQGPHLTEAHIKLLEAWEKKVKKLAFEMVTQLPFILMYDEHDYEVKEL